MERLRKATITYEGLVDADTNLPIKPESIVIEIGVDVFYGQQEFQK
jgi:hypothetical protein